MSISASQVQSSAHPPASAASLPATGFVRESRLMNFLPFSHSTLWRRVAAGKFPPPIKLSEKITAWRAEDVHAWIAAQGQKGAQPARR